jgi:hypothetical protein
MEQQRFDALTRTLRSRPTRRDVLRGLAAIGIGLATTRLPAAVEAETSYGCRKVGGACKRASQCCSGICERRNGKKTCRAHGTATCRQGVPGVCTADIPELLRCGSNSDCFCFRTTAGSNFCGAWFGGTKICHACSKDTDCEALGLPGSACVPVAVGNCAAVNCEGGMMCMAPCGYQPPGP